MASHSNRCESGFSLIEIMVALLILSAVSVVAMDVSSTALGQTAHLKQKMMAPWVAENRITKIRIALQQELDISLDEEETSQADIHWVTKVDIIKKTESLTRIAVTVALASNPKSQVYSLDTYLPTALVTKAQ
jgi:general secretion pathway protein I